jgi:putative holliday junction resolvase
LMAHPRPYLDGKDPKRVLAKLAELAKAEGVSLFVVGLPRSLNGTEGPPARRARKFAADHERHTGLKVELIDEWLSTREAGLRLREQGVNAKDARSRIDSAAAAVLLQSWLDSQRSRTL